MAVPFECPRGRRADFAEVARQNPGVTPYALVGTNHRATPSETTGSVSDAITAWTFNKSRDGGTTYWIFAFAPRPRLWSSETSVWSAFKPVGRPRRTSDVCHPLLDLVGDTRDHDFWLTLLFYAAWPALPGFRMRRTTTWSMTSLSVEIGSRLKTLFEEVLKKR